MREGDCVFKPYTTTAVRGEKVESFNSHGANQTVALAEEVEPSLASRLVAPQSFVAYIAVELSLVAGTCFS